MSITFFRNQDLKWMEALYSTCQRLGKVAEPVAGDLNIIQFLPKSNDSTFPLNVNVLNICLFNLVNRGHALSTPFFLKLLLRLLENFSFFKFLCAYNYYEQLR